VHTNLVEVEPPEHVEQRALLVRAQQLVAVDEAGRRF